MAVLLPFSFSFSDTQDCQRVFSQLEPAFKAKANKAMGPLTNAEANNFVIKCTELEAAILSRRHVTMVPHFCSHKRGCKNKSESDSS